MMVSEAIRHADEVIAAALVCMAKAQMVLHDHATRRPLVAVPPAVDTGSPREGESNE